jgi:GT2 family glycosyltransferase
VSEPLAVVPTYLREPSDLELALNCLESLRRTEPDLACLVVDDGSPAQQLVAELDAARSRLQFELVRKESNSGFSRTVNVGLRRALSDGRDAILVNADLEFIEAGWAQRMVAQRCEDSERLASVVGALLVYPNGLIQHGGIFFCSPGDEPILTAQDGYVPIAQLDPSMHGVVSYARRENRIYRCATCAGRRSPGSGRRQGGYPFEVTSRPYSGELLALGTKNGTARVTPNHRLTVFWTEHALGSWAVYLMRRGRDWRIGHTRMAQGWSRPGTRGYAFGPRMRLHQQRADAIWLLELCDSKPQAIERESLLAWTYGVPTMQFTLSSSAGLEQARQDYIWSQLDTERSALVLLSLYGRSPEYPLLARLLGSRSYPCGAGRRYPMVAANVMPGYMRLPSDPGCGQRPDISDVVVDREHFHGEVYSLGVRPHEHYISGGVVTHNSLLHREFDHIYRYAPHDLPEAQHARTCPVTGALQFIRHECLASVGVYDEGYSMGFEDVDYCLRVFESGRSCVYQPRVRAFHHESVFRGRPSPKVEDWQIRSKILLLQRWGHKSMGRWVPSIV